ncbi:hypothetical protein IMG5_173110 [Ichthyophthirius multifiliis]|uniref:60S ribosomal protein L6 n=1 Tax=Ichthyophthirius multifiliis TaxID=5932 RepID=G0R1V7_ICHMU|nr:hypothetical protein IMG5_173110 [Ichthyophthirius multifiliis]EGR28546.1 hypothetical protein IMG5_173110 [Ichthyophthirius multifiliis]|eukprot:XP_004029782.1 hypothetical protein IMG5_173110 [Ichthyophthirius multifiliis]
MAKGAAKGSTKGVSKVSKWYKPDDESSRFHRRQTQRQSAPKLRSNITPGSVLILLAGKFRGKRVVFLKQLKSGLLLVTGPHKVNGVPLKRVNQAYVIPTTTKVQLGNIDLNKYDDAYLLENMLDKTLKPAFSIQNSLKNKRRKNKTEKMQEKQTKIMQIKQFLIVLKKQSS